MPLAEKSIEGFLAAAHHAALAQNHGARVIKALAEPESNVGTTFSCSHVEPYTNHREKDIKSC